MSFVDYIVQALLNGGLILLVGVATWILIAWCLNFLSNVIRNRLCFLGDRTFIYLTAPGVAVHELSHAAFCVIFRHKIVKMSLFSPEADGTLGYVEHRYDPKSLYQRVGNFFIGTGPIWGGLALLYFLSVLLLPWEMFSSDKSWSDNIFALFRLFFSLKSWTSLWFYVWLYAALTISSHITLSPPDIKGAKDGFIVLVGVIFLSCLLFGWCGSWEEYLVHELSFILVRLISLVATSVSALLVIALILRLMPFGKK